MRWLLGLFVVILTGFGVTWAGGLSEPALRLPASSSGAPRIAVTLDACMGKTDLRILDTLIDEQIPVTVFVTKRWIEANPEAVQRLLAYPALFDIEDHGRDHVPAVTGMEKPYGITPAGTLSAVAFEVVGGADAIQEHFGIQPRWFRGATALYSADALAEIDRLGFKVAGFSLNADFGASASAEVARQRLAAAKDGDVVIAHINQPTRPAGEGIAQGLIDLKRAGYQFVRLDQLR